MNKLPLTEIEDQAGERALFERALALDRYLAGCLGPAWQGLRDNIGRLPESGGSSRHLCHFFLIAVAAAKLAQAPRPGDSPELLDLGRPFRSSGQVALARGAGSLSLLLSHASIESDLSAAWHPSWKIGKLSPFEAVDQCISDQISDALRLIEASSETSARMVSALCSEICLLDSRGTVETGSAISMTSRIVPGLIYFTPASVLLTAESIVHEVAHLWLSRHEAGRALYVDPNRLVPSPLRTDPRPLSGLTHQVWVLSNLVPYYFNLLKVADPIVARNKEKIAKRLAQHQSDLQSGLNTIRNNAGGLSDLGKELLSRIVAANG